MICLICMPAPLRLWAYMSAHVTTIKQSTLWYHTFNTSNEIANINFTRNSSTFLIKISFDFQLKKSRIFIKVVAQNVVTAKYGLVQ